MVTRSDSWFDRITHNSSVSGLPMKSDLPPRGQWTADLLAQLPEDKHLKEVIEGQLHVVYGNESSHTIAVWSLALILAPYAWSHRLEFLLGPKPLTLSSQSEVQPDIVVLPRQSGSFDGDVLTGVELVVEVTTPYSRNTDHGLKQRLYRASGVHEYWIVDYLYREVSVWSNRCSRQTNHTDVLTWVPRWSDGSLTVDLQAYFNGIPEFDFTFDNAAPWIRRISSMGSREKD